MFPSFVWGRSKGRAMVADPVATQEPALGPAIDRLCALVTCSRQAKAVAATLVL